MNALKFTLYRSKVTRVCSQQESPTAADLKFLLLALKFNKPPPNISPAMLFQKVQPKLQETVKLAGADLTGKPLFNGFLSDKQWHDLTNVQKDLDTDYTIRREMLLKRLDCTIQSFQVSKHQANAFILPLSNVMCSLSYSGQID